ncbi:MAG: helix-turn-helix transcriptional regulator [Deltaproteobacteria bacterium]|nr:helix-turn-helix transcriptional regulator [Deltaproteobacteria bacterium]
MPSDALRDLVSARLAAARKEAGITQQTLGALARVEPCAPCRYEGGFHVPTLRILAQLASALGLTPSELLREPSPRAPSRSRSCSTSAARSPPTARPPSTPSAGPWRR